jgi:hypothetical protein
VERFLAPLMLTIGCPLSNKDSASLEEIRETGRSLRESLPSLWSCLRSCAISLSEKFALAPGRPRIQSPEWCFSPPADGWITLFHVEGVSDSGAAALQLEHTSERIRDGALFDFSSEGPDGKPLVRSCSKVRWQA